MGKVHRVCVVGATGGWFQKVHHPALLRLAGRVKLAAASARQPEGQALVTGKLGFEHAYVDYEEMIEKEKPDFVFLSVADTSTAEMACRILEHKIPLLMEKPVGRNVEDGLRVRAMADAAGVPVMVAFNRRFTPFILRAKQLAAERGNISQYVCEWLRHDVKSPKELMGSALHCIDTLRFLAGDLASFSGVPSATQYFDKALIASSFYLTFKSGAVGTLTHNIRAGRAYERYRIIAENWMVTISQPSPGIFDDRLSFEVEADGKVVERILHTDIPEDQRSEGYSQGFWRESEYFVECLEKGRRPSPDVAEAVRSMELAEEMLQRVIKKQ
jgi:predicted dehydrogenase